MAFASNGVEIERDGAIVMLTRVSSKLPKNLSKARAHGSNECTPDNLRLDSYIVTEAVLSDRIRLNLKEDDLAV